MQIDTGQSATGQSATVPSATVPSATVQTTKGQSITAEHHMADEIRHMEVVPRIRRKYVGP